MPCKNKEYRTKIEEHGIFWFLENYIRADHGELHCYETITCTTHSDVIFMNDLISLVERYIFFSS